jgi:hypothetical protein
MNVDCRREKVTWVGMSQYKIRSRPFNDERLPYSGRSLAANRKTEPE